MSFRSWLPAVALCALLPLQLHAQTGTTGTTSTAGPPAAAAQPTFATLQGTVADSVHGAPLANARVFVEGTNRSALTGPDGQYRIDSIPPGGHRVVVSHPLLDTLGVSMRTGEYDFVAGQAQYMDLAVPGGERLTAAFCPAALWARRGPASLVGFVRDPDSNAPVAGAKVSLVYQMTDPIGRKSPVVREAPVDSTGVYHICGLPDDMTGKVQVFVSGVSSGEVPVTVANGIGLRAFSVAEHQVVALVKGDSGRMKRVAYGSAKVIGKVMNKSGRPLEGARVVLQGGGTVAITKANGTFTLDSLPSGTQSLEVRKLGYSAQEVPLELSANTPAHTTVTMEDYVELAPVVVEAATNQALDQVGYTRRKQTGMGYYFDGNSINHQSLTFSDVLRNKPGVQVLPTGDGRTYEITDARNPSNSCVNFYVDGTLWKEMTPGDIDNYVRPSELVALEIYHTTSAPPEFIPPGGAECLTIVAWTEARLSTLKKKKPSP